MAKRGWRVESLPGCRTWFALSSSIWCACSTGVTGFSGIQYMSWPMGRSFPMSKKFAKGMVHWKMLSLRHMVLATRRISKVRPSWPMQIGSMLLGDPNSLVVFSYNNRFAGFFTILCDWYELKIRCRSIIKVCRDPGQNQGPLDLQSNLKGLGSNSCSIKCS